MSKKRTRAEEASILSPREDDLPDWPVESEDEPVADEPADPLLKELAKRPLGVEARPFSVKVGLDIGACYARLNEMVKAGLAHRLGTKYQITLEGMKASRR